MAKIFLVVALATACLVAGLQAAAVEEVAKSYPGFQNIGTVEVASPSGAIGVSAVSRKTYHLSVEQADWADAYYHCTRSIFGGQLLVIDTQDEYQRVFDLLVQNRFTSGALWTGGVRSGTQFGWLPNPNYYYLPAYFWGAGEPRADPYYDVAVFVKNGFAYNFQSYPSGAMYMNRYICQVIAD